MSRPVRPYVAEFCPMPGYPADGETSGWQRWIVVAWNVVFYAMLLGFTASLVASGRGAATAALGVTLALLLGGWYTWWMLLRADLLVRSVELRVTYFAVAAVLWAGLVALDRNYANLGLIAAIQLFGYLRPRSALAGMSVVLLVWLGGDLLHDSPAAAAALRWPSLRWDELASAILTVALAGLCVYSFRQLSRARSELASAERRAGTLGERQRIAADIHDTLTQGLASVVMLLEAAQASRRAGTPEAGRRIEEAACAAREGLREVRRLVWDLRPEALERGSLGEALNRLTAQLEEQTGTLARTVITGEVRSLDPQVEMTLLRVAQEALANVRRHAEATQVTATLSYIEDRVALDVQDDGRGFDPARPVAARPGGGLGLAAMRERVKALGGSLSIESAPGEGATVAVQLPAGRQISAAAGGGAAGR
jgi:signal transduction histidine kinase